MERIVIIGANQYQNPLILKAKEMGLETHVFAWQTGDPGEYSADYFYPVSITNQKFICNECKRLKPKAIVTGASDLAMITVAYVAAELGLEANSPEAVRKTTNKIEMRRSLQMAGLTQPSFVEIGDRFPEEEITALRYPLVVKPSDRSGGRGVLRVENARELRSAVVEARDISFERRAIVEEAIEGCYYSVESISFRGEHHILAITENDTIERGGVYIGLASRQPAQPSRELSLRLEKIAMETLTSLGLTTGASHIEFVVTPEGEPYLLGVNASMGGDFVGSDLTPISTGMDYLGMIINTARGKAPDLSASGRKQDTEVRFVTCRADAQKMEELQRSNRGILVRSRIYREDRMLPEQPGKKRFGYYLTARRPREMGGYLPLELAQGKEWFQDIEPEKIRRLNSGRTAIWYAVRSAGMKRVFVPHFCCPNVALAIEDAGAEVVYYHINENLMPAEMEPSVDDGILIVNYFGILDRRIEEFILKYPRNRWILDNSGAFFCPPVLREGVYNIYSSRKFVGVSDGGYLIGSPIEDVELEMDCSALRAGFLLECIEKGTNGAYRKSLDNEQALEQSYKNMSVLTERILDSVDYERIRRKRKDNYKFLEEMLGEKNLLHIDTEEAVPLYYPFLCNEDIRSALIKKRIYIPLLWRKCLTEEFAGTIEERYASQICCLPIDQRYEKADMEYLCSVVLDLLK